MRAIPDAGPGCGSDAGESQTKEAAMSANLLPARAGVMLAALVIGAAACGSGGVDKAGGAVARPVVLTLVDGDADTFNAQPFATAVSRLSHGSLQIKIEGDWRPTDPTYETDLIKTVQAGKAQLGITASRAFDTVGIDSFQALQAPFLIDNYPLEQKVLDSAIPAAMLRGLNFYRHDHDYASSDTEVWGPYVWSVYRDTLTFKTTAGFQGPTGLTLRPWDKIGAA